MRHKQMRINAIMMTDLTKHFSMLVLVESLFLALYGWFGLGCGIDDKANGLGSGIDIVTGDASGDATIDIVGRWQLISVEPQMVGVGDLPEQILEIKPDGTWSSTTVSEVPTLGKFTVTTNGNYKIAGDSVSGETTAIQSEPDLGIPLSIRSGIAGEFTVERDGNKLIIISNDEASGQTIIAVYEKR